MGATAAAAASAAIARAIKASGAIVRVEPAEFLRLVARNEAPLVVVSYGGLLKKRYKYLVSYKGFVFFTQAVEQLVLPSDCEMVGAERIWVPD